MKFVAGFCNCPKIIISTIRRFNIIVGGGGMKFMSDLYAFSNSKSMSVREKGQVRGGREIASASHIFLSLLHLLVGKLCT